MSSYAFGKTITMGADDAVKRVTEALAAEGFGVLTDIDVAATLKKKIDQDIPPYRILGACNPNFAHKAIAAEPQIGALLPCNVVVRQDRQGQTYLEFMDPLAVMDLVGRPEIHAIATEVRQRLERVMAAV
jgi:uncharacterized protein (DUF302 family)